MERPLLIIISGPPGTGKTTLGRRVADRFSLPFLYKDGIKETLFDSLGWSDREWSRKLGLATYALLYHLLEEQLRARKSLVVESNFSSELGTPRFRDLQARYPFRAFQVQCATRGELLLERFTHRDTSGERHPGHVDKSLAKELRDILLRGREDPLDIEGTVYELDTTDFESIDYEALFKAIEAEMAGEEQRKPGS